MAHYRERRVPLRIAGNRTITVDFQVTDVRKPNLERWSILQRGTSETRAVRFAMEVSCSTRRQVRWRYSVCGQPFTRWNAGRNETRKALDLEALVVPLEPALLVGRAADEVMRDVEEAGPVAIPETGIHEDEVARAGSQRAQRRPGHDSDVDVSLGRNSGQEPADGHVGSSRLLLSSTAKLPAGIYCP